MPPKGKPAPQGEPSPEKTPATKATKATTPKSDKRNQDVTRRAAFSLITAVAKMAKVQARPFCCVRAARA